MSLNTCKECGSVLINYHNKIVCSQCGLVHYESYFPSETIVVNEETKNLPSLPLGGKLLSMFNFFKDHYNNILSEDVQSYLATIKKLDDKLKAFHASSKISSEILNNLMRICAEIGFRRQLAIETLTLYMKAIKLLKVQKIKFTKPTISAACLLVVSRLYGNEKILSLSEVVKIYRKIGHRVIKSKVAWCASIINKKLIDKPISNEEILKNYLERFVSILQNENVNKKKIIRITKVIPWKLFINLIRRKSFEIINSFEDANLQGKNPLILAATILYIANRFIANKVGLKQALSQKDIASACCVPEYSLRDNIPFVLDFIKIKNAI